MAVRAMTMDEKHMSDEAQTLYEERDGIAIITLNRPHKKNALTDAMVQGVADSVDRATAANHVAAIVLRGAGDTLTAGYDLGADYSGAMPPTEWSTPYGGPQPQHRDGAWDPISDYQFMQNNVRRFMRLWECPKPVLAEVKGWAVGGATDLILCADQLYMAADAHIGYAPSRVYGVPTTMMWVHRLKLEHAKQFLLTGRAIDAETALRIGLVAHVCEPESLAATIEQDAQRFCHIPANQLALNKMLINQAYENMGLRTSQMLGTIFDGIARHTEEALRWRDVMLGDGVKAAVVQRDGPWQDYSQMPRKEDQ